MLFRHRPVPLSVLAPLLAIAFLFVAGCASDDRPTGSRKNRGDRPPSVPTLTGSETFFAGRIVALVRIGPLAGFEPGGRDERAGPERRPRRGPPGPGGGMGDGPGASRPRMDGAGPVPRASMGRGSPPVAIHLRFTNSGTTRAELQIVDFLSPLGNFVVHPASLTLEPGQSLDVEPMASRLAGEAASGEITLSLRLDGIKDAKTVTVQPEARDKPPGEN